MLPEVHVVIDPPCRSWSEHKITRAVSSQPLKIDNRLRAVFRFAIVDSILLQKMPAFAFGIIQNRWVTVIRRKHQRTCRCDSFQNQSRVAQWSGARLVKIACINERGKTD